MREEKSILVIDDEAAICSAFKRFFEPRSWHVRVAATGREGLAAYQNQPADVVFLDVRLPDGNGLDVLDELRGRDAEARVIVITAYGDMKTVMRSIEGKAFDYLVKPLDLDQAAALAERALQASAAARTAQPAQRADADETALIGSSALMQGVYKQIGMLAQTDSTVLILGATGSGKEMVARAVHQYSRRKSGPFAAVNCGALPENLVESELFGHVRGAFTGADADRAGRFESADTGTLFLDEVGDLPPAAQVKLLRVLDFQIVERVGSVQPIPLSVRVLAATNRDMTAEVRAGRFRADLYYRLAVTQIQLPPLADRGEDITELADHFLTQLAPPGEPPRALSPLAAEALRRYSWPGNVRELRNVLQHVAALAPGREILPEDLPEAVRSAPDRAADADRRAAIVHEHLATLPDAGDLYRAAIEPVEKAVILHALRRCRGNQSEAAALLGLHRNTLRKKIRQFDIDVGVDR